MAEIDRVLARMKPLARAPAPIEAPRAAVKGAHWIEPKLLAEIAFTEMTSDGILRHPSYLGLREDKRPNEVVVEKAKPLKRAVGKTSAPKAKRK